ncbi:helix-turn-helix transcriptional regulator [uncultured Bosea sp.]|uniref:helix-turn-helix domain-containing protein n=1 Tax=uncultured Bosea sp. TaxID=211457 RepID=UPI00263AE4E6|nr:helix-turn-helix transcriptional regulator [uncultured Bosea sp.]
MTPAQCRAARGLLDWSQADLAQSANVGLSTLKNFEGGRSAPMANNLAAMRSALEAGGVTFLADGETVDGGPGVRLRKGE